MLNITNTDRSAACQDRAIQQAVLYRGTAATTQHIGRFVTVLIGELFAWREGLHYEAVYTAFIRSGIQPPPILECEGAHFETYIQRLNLFADALVAAVSEDTAIHTAISTAATSLLNEHTIPAPTQHLTSSEIREYVACCSRTGDTHVTDYDVFASWRAHLGMCSACSARLVRQAASQTSAAQYPNGAATKEAFMP